MQNNLSEKKLTISGRMYSGKMWISLKLVRCILGMWTLVRVSINKTWMSILCHRAKLSLAVTVSPTILIKHVFNIWNIFFMAPREKHYSRIKLLWGGVSKRMWCFDLLLQVLITHWWWPVAWPRYWREDLVVDGGIPTAPVYNEIIPPVSGSSLRPPPMGDQDL